MVAPLSAWPWDNLGWCKVQKNSMFLEVLRMFLFLRFLLIIWCFLVLWSMFCLDLSWEKLYIHGFMRIIALNIGVCTFWWYLSSEDAFIRYWYLWVTCFSSIEIAGLFNGELISNRLIKNGTGIYFNSIYWSFYLSSDDHTCICL